VVVHTIFVNIEIINKMMVEIDFDKINHFKEILQAGKNFVIVTHVNPDGDAIGSTLALWGILRKIGKTADVIIPNEFPDFLQWI
jgi:bifunctional oligoribonuclease and PAP phosphatase NrnA